MSIKVDVGTPPEGYKEWTTALVRFHGFANISTTRDDPVISPRFLCVGHEWKLILYPGGRASSKEGYVGAALINKSNASVKIQWGMSIKDKDYREIVRGNSKTFEFGADSDEGAGNVRSVSSFARRSKLMDKLVDGALVIEVRMKSTITDKTITQFIPSNPIKKNVLQKFMDEETADVVFEVDDSKSRQSDEEHTNKKSKTIKTLHAHSFILQDISTMLSELCKSDDGGRWRDYYRINYRC